MADPRKSPSWKKVLDAHHRMKAARRINDKGAFAAANADYEKAMAACQTEQGAEPGPKFRQRAEKILPVPPDPHIEVESGPDSTSTVRAAAEAKRLAQAAQKAAAEKAEKAAAEKAAAEKAAAEKAEKAAAEKAAAEKAAAEKADTKPETPSAKGKKKSKKKEK